MSEHWSTPLSLAIAGRTWEPERLAAMIRECAPKIRPLEFCDGVCDTPVGRFRMWYKGGIWKGSFSPWTDPENFTRWEGTTWASVYFKAHDVLRGAIEPMLSRGL